MSGEFGPPLADPETVAIGENSRNCFPSSPMPTTLPAPRPDTPCVGFCSTTFDEVCRGCLRTAAEVTQWLDMDAQQREPVWQRIIALGWKPRQRR